jgi:hypothetical protein
MHVFDWFYELNFFVLYPLTIIVLISAGEIGIYLGRRRPSESEFGTPTGAALGLLALLLAFSVSLSVGRFDDRRRHVLEEADAISSTANFALMLPQQSQAAILPLLHEYVTVRIGLGIPYDPIKFDRDVARSVEIETALWTEAIKVVAISDTPRTNRFVNALNQMSSLHERRVTALRYHVPGIVTAILVGIAMTAMGFSGFHAGTSSGGRHVVVTLMALMVAIVLMLIVDLDRPARGMIRVSTQPLLDAAQNMPTVNR